MFWKFLSGTILAILFVTLLWWLFITGTIVTQILFWVIIVALGLVAYNVIKDKLQG